MLLFARTTTTKPSTVDEALGSLSQSLQHLADIAAKKSDEVVHHAAQAAKHVEAQAAAAAEEARARLVHGKISDLIGR